MALRRRGRPTLGGVALELASPCCATLARRPRRSGVRRGVVAPGRAEAGAPLVLALGLCVTVVPAAACHFCASGMDTGSPRRPATGTIRYLGYRASDIDTLGTKGIRETWNDLPLPNETLLIGSDLSTVRAELNKLDLDLQGNKFTLTPLTSVRI
uniref:Uncharacterized protein n=1 Tax=Oryza sativa subsp. japonica TaxID=39947 RepID=Q10JK3_ORYSJ|nr:hypothetical protein LOC_Os03g30334 [Oryza sativa Japonica Group]